MISPDNSCRGMNMAVDALIALAFKTVEEDESSNAEIARHLSTDIELPPSYQAALDSLGPDLMQRMIRGDIKPQTRNRFGDD